MISISKFLTLAVTTFVATPVLATTPGIMLQAGPLMATSTVVPASSCGWTTVKRRNGQTALKLDVQKWRSKACESDRKKYQIVPTPTVSQPNPIHIGCDYRIFIVESSDSTTNAQQRTDDLNRQCLIETARMKEEFEVKKEHHRQKQREVDEAKARAEQAHKIVVETQGKMKTAFDETMTAHNAKNWPVYYAKLEVYKNKVLQHEAAVQTYAGFLATYESLIASLA
jgi:hypothetical protein